MNRLIVGLTKTALSLVAEPEGTLILDLCGRPLGFFSGGYYYARGLDNRWTEKKWRGRLRHLRALSPHEGDKKQGAVRALLEEALHRLNELRCHGQLEVLHEGRRVAPNPAFLGRRLRGVLRFNQNGLAGDVARYHQTYRSVGILPPDQYWAVVVQFAEGCFWNRCAFCSSFQGRRFHVKTTRELQTHLARVKKYFGRSLPARVSVFLGDADVFQAPAGRLLRACASVQRAFPQQARPQPDGVGGIYAFGEVTGILRTRPRDLARLKAAGLRRVYVGLETACEPLRRAAHKPGTSPEALEALTRLKNAGLEVGVIVLLGLGGKKWRERHVRDTARLIRSVSWGPGDIVYFSPLRGALAARGTALSEKEMDRQRERLCRALGPRAPQTALYDIREFIY